MLILFTFILGIEITDAQKEREAIAALRDAESRVNHSVSSLKFETKNGK